jgi:hypothetical protein
MDTYDVISNFDNTVVATGRLVMEDKKFWVLVVRSPLGDSFLYPFEKQLYNPRKITERQKEGGTQCAHY